MSQAGKVLHLYVEVRSVAEDDGKLPGRGDGGTPHLMLQCPDGPPNTQRSSSHSSPNRSPDVSPNLQQHMGGRNHSLPSSLKPSRQSVSFHLQNPDGSPTQFQRQDVMYDNFGQLLECLAPGTTSPDHHGPLRHTFSSDVGPYQARLPISSSSTSSGRLTVPSTPTSSRRSYEVPGVASEEGKTSVVSFGYIDKANVHSMAGHRASLCQNKPSSPLKRTEGRHAHSQNRLSDPVWYSGHPVPGDPLSCPPYPPLGSPYLHRAAVDAFTRDSTYRALEEFGSPEIRRRLSGHGLENCSPTLTRHSQYPRCRSWGGSPILPRSTLTLPSKTQLLQLDRGMCRSSVNGLPRSPASDHLCAHTGYSSHSAAPSSALHSQFPAQVQQRPWLGDESSRLSSKFHPPLPAGRPTDIQHDAPTRTVDSHHTVNSVHYSSDPHLRPPRCSSRASDAVGSADSSRSVSPFSNPEVASKLAVEATRLSSMFAERRTPSPTHPHAESPRSESPYHPYSTRQGQNPPDPLHVDKQNQSQSWKADKPAPHTKPGRISPLPSQRGLSSPASPAMPARLHRVAASQSPVLDPRQQRSLSPNKDLTALHRYQPPQYTGDRKSPAAERRKCDHLFNRSAEDSPEIHRRHMSSPNTDALPVSWTSRHPVWREAELSRARVKAEGGDGREKSTEQECKRRAVGVSMDQREEVQDHSGATGSSSRSSSGVTGSLGDSSQQDRNDSLSPETLSQSSHDTADSGSGIQVCWGEGGVSVCEDVIM